MPTRPRAAARWVGRAPARIRPYLELMRLDRPIGTWLVVLPGWIALALTAELPAQAWLLVLVLGHGALMRAAGCTVNDIVDRRFDAQVPRTADRPLAAGRITVRGAWLLFAAQMVVALALPLVAGTAVFWLTAASWVPMIAYPFMKRITNWPHVWLGFTLTIYVPVACVAATGEFGAPGIALYLGLVCWSIGCDIVYAHQDREADKIAGVRSAAVRLGDRTVPLVAALYAATVVGIAVAGALAGLGVLFWPLLAVAGLHLARQLRGLDTADPAVCHRAFLSNAPFAALVLAAVLAGRAL
ncbi:4-hydroxybenzoate octaprenyltransferase [Streptodolium elevatio]|uniref:4-hydroxybenzoate octaprenyltransferase n=1 Tax=Streptodolium elevatio TaxID=3157996 RepID=A0ABV3DJV5_9ACTN